MRGSIPAHWSQDIAKMVPKPPIGIDLADPYAETAGILEFANNSNMLFPELGCANYRKTLWRTNLSIW